MPRRHDVLGTVLLFFTSDPLLSGITGVQRFWNLLLRNMALNGIFEV